MVTVGTKIQDGSLNQKVTVGREEAPNPTPSRMQNVGEIGAASTAIEVLINHGVTGNHKLKERPVSM